MSSDATSTVADRNLDFCDPRLYDDPWETYRWLREQDSLYYDAVNDLYIAPRYEDVFHVSRNAELYCNRFGVRPKIAGDMSIITLDGEEHMRQRRLINRGFTPRQARALIPHVRELTNQIVDKVAERGEVDFVEDVAIHVPLIIIAEMLGLDPEQRMKMYRWSDDMMAGDGHTEADDPVLIRAGESFLNYAVLCSELIAERRANPSDDLISMLTSAFDEGLLAKDGPAYQGLDEEHAAKRLEGRLDDEDLLAFLTVLLVAGNETTRNALSGGLHALSRFPEQRQLLLDNLDVDDFMDGAVDEIIRYVSPVLSFIRTVTEDHTYRNTDLKKGDRILMLYGSANRDERAFDNPDELDLTRDPNGHLAFGIGPHFCLGANIARMEVKTVFQELLGRLPDLTIPPDVTVSRGDSCLVIGLQHLPATFTPTEARCPVQH